MLARLLRVLLVVTLVLNGIAAPSAMARMSHAEPATQASASETSMAAMHHDPAAMAHHDHGAMDTMAPATGIDGSCCDGSDCQCGCVLPPAVSPDLPLLLVGATERQVHLAPRLHLVPFRDIPPLRPPAV